MEAGTGRDPENEPLEEIEQQAGEVLAPPPGHPRFPGLDSLRAFAAIAVLLVHVGIFTGGFEPWYKQLFAHLDIGVPFFFLLSGFLLYRPMLASKVLGLPRQRLGDYARNRFFRIFPLFWVVLTVVAIVPGMEGIFSGNWWVYYGLLDNYPIYTAQETCAGNPFACGIPPAWSLGLELAFYVALPFIAWFIFSLMSLLRRVSWVWVNLVVLGAAGLASFFIQGSVPTSDLDQWLFYSPLGRAWWFALGMGMAVISVLAQQEDRTPAGFGWIARRPGVAWLIAGAGYFVMAIFVLEPGPSLNFPTTGRGEYLTEYFIFGLISALVLLPAILGHQGASSTRRLLRHPALIWLGLISYGIFLWHFPVMRALLDLGVAGSDSSFRFPLLAISTLAATVALSAITYYSVERPLMTWSRRRGKRVNQAG
ncbi:MAG: acyltransferase family protein [Solirubrobacterales bacterium]